MLHEPKQGRSRRTLERIISAARHLMATEGVDAVGITQIVKEARSSVGSFYARFDGKEDLVRYLHNRLWQETLDRWVETTKAWDDGSELEGQVEALVTALREAIEPDFVLRSSLSREMGSVGSEAVRVFERQLTADGLSLLDRGNDLRHPSPEEAVTTGILIALSTLRHHLSAPPQIASDGSVDPLDDLARELGRALKGYWGVGRVVQDSHGGGTRIEYFDIWG